MGCFLVLQPPTPHLEEDLKEVLRSESGIELIIVDELSHDRYKRKPGVIGLLLLRRAAFMP